MTWDQFYPVQPARARQPGSATTSIASLATSTVPMRVVLIALAVLSFAQVSLQQKDPVNNFCRRFGHQTAVVDQKLFIDGGLVDWNPITSYPQNYTNTWLSYHDLSAVADSGMPQLYANLSKNGTIPNVNGGALWADDVNKRLYLFGGEYYQEPPTTFNLYAYDILADHWDNYGVPRSNPPITGVSYGAGVSVPSRGEAYYFGGWMSNASVPGWGSAPPVATANLVKYTMDTNSWVNNTGPDGIRRAEGSLHFLPVSDQGMLVYFGGVRDVYGNGTVTPQAMDEIYVWDVLSSKWYTQNATGAIPPSRRRFCAGMTAAPDRSSYNIYLYGGLGIPGFPNAVGFDDVYVLSIPSFTWVKMFPLDREGTGDYPHHSLSCNVVNNAQMIIIGGTFPLSTDCDAPTQWGAHNLDMGKQNEDHVPWKLYAPNKTSYVVPEEIISAVGGSPSGGATKTAPINGFSHNDLKILMTRKAQIAERTPTRAVGDQTGTPGSGGLSTGALAGIAVAGAVVLILVAVGVFFLIKRQRKRKQESRPVAGYPDSQAGFQHMGSSAWTTSPSSHFTASSPYQSHSFPQRSPAVPPYDGLPVELPAAMAHYTPQNTPPPQGQHGYHLPGQQPGQGVSPSNDQVKYDAQGNAWVPQVSMVQVSPLHQRSPSGSPMHDGIRQVPGAGGYPFAHYHSHSPVTPQSATAQPPQELDPSPAPGAARDGSTGDSGPRHNTYYNP